MAKTSKVTKLYRFDDPIPNFQEDFKAEEFEVTRETPKGFWINAWMHGKPRYWVAKTGFKRFAYPTKIEAAQSYIARKNKQLIKVEEAKKRATDALTFFTSNYDEIVGDKPIKLIEHKMEEELRI